MKVLWGFLILCVSLVLSVISFAAYDTLGATVIRDGSSVSTRFAIWNPDKVTPASVFVQLPGQTSFTQYPLTLQQSFSDNGVNQYTNVYSVTIPQDCNLSEYYFQFDGVTVRDPYSRMTTGYSTEGQTSEIQYVNTGTAGSPIPATAPTTPPVCPGPATNIVIDLSQLNTPNYNLNRPALASQSDAIVYELDVMDYTSNPNSGVKNGGTFTGLVQSGSSTSQSTALQNLIDLGITHAQIMPMFTYNFSGYSYNWGYNPMDYNVPQSQYSMYPINQYVNRIEEVQNMVNTFHKNGLRVVMDVVYNHTYSASVFSANSPVTNAYYLTDSSGNLIDDTGCGNTVAVANPMVSNMVADSMAYWMIVYGIDGYRFDEMASFDYSIVSAWTEYLNNLNPGQNYVYYGEPWNCGSTGINNGINTGNIASTEYMNNGVLTLGAGCFNGPYRNALIGPSQQSNTYGGYIFNQIPAGLTIQGLMGQMQEGFMGSIRPSSESTTTSVPPNLNNSWVNAYTNMPAEAINYVSCHDGLTLWDKICAQDPGGGAQSWSNQYFQQIDMFAQGILMTSQGIPFIAEGDEFLRSKGGNNNSYNAPLSVNWISWSNKATNLNVFKYYQKMIALRKANPAFSLGTLTDISKGISAYSAYNSSTQDGVMIGLVTDTVGNQYIVIYNSGSDYNYTIGSGEWMILTNINDTGITSIQSGQYPAVGSTVSTGQNVLCAGTSVTVLANMNNPQTPALPTVK